MLKFLINFRKKFNISVRILNAEKGRPAYGQVGLWWLFTVGCVWFYQTKSTEGPFGMLSRIGVPAGGSSIWPVASL